MNKKQKIKKGDFGYIQSQKKKRTIYTILALIPPGLSIKTGIQYLPFLQRWVVCRHVNLQSAQL